MVQRKITTLRLVDELDVLVNRAAKKKGVSKNALIIEAIWQYVEKLNTKQLVKEGNQK